MNGAPTMTDQQVQDQIWDRLEDVRFILRRIRMAEEHNIQWDLTNEFVPAIIWGEDEHSVKTLDALAEDEYYRQR